MPPRYRWPFAGLLTAIACGGHSPLTTDPPPGVEVYYECVYTSREINKVARWREIHGQDPFIADQLALEKCRVNSREPSTCFRSFCRWKEGAPMRAEDPSLMRDRAKTRKGPP